MYLCRFCGLAPYEAFVCRRLVRGDFLVATTFLARRIHFWSLNEDRRLKRLFAYAYHHLSESLAHQLHPSDRAAAFLG